MCPPRSIEIEVWSMSEAEDHPFPPGAIPLFGPASVLDTCTLQVTIESNDGTMTGKAAAGQEPGSEGESAPPIVCTAGQAGASSSRNFTLPSVDRK